MLTFHANNHCRSHAPSATIHLSCPTLPRLANDVGLGLQTRRAGSPPLPLPLHVGYRLLHPFPRPILPMNTSSMMYRYFYPPYTTVFVTDTLREQLRTRVLDHPRGPFFFLHHRRGQPTNLPACQILEGLSRHVPRFKLTIFVYNNRIVGYQKQATRL